MQRLHRLIDEIAQLAEARKGESRPSSFGPEATELRRAAHRALAAVGQNIEGLRFNVAVAQIYELSNVLSTALAQRGEGLAWAIRESAGLLVQMVAPMMPHLAEECWARLGYNTLVSDQRWPIAEQGLLVDDMITIAVQVNGKRRDEIKIDRVASKSEIEAAALALESVTRALHGRPVKKVIVVPQRIVNVVG